MQQLKKALVPTFVLTLGTKRKLELDDRSCLGCLAGVNSECKLLVAWMKCFIGNCTNLENNAISDREPMQ